MGNIIPDYKKSIVERQKVFVVAAYFGRGRIFHEIWKKHRKQTSKQNTGFFSQQILTLVILQRWVHSDKLT